MTALLFFLAGIPAAFGLSRAVEVMCRASPVEDAEGESAAGVSPRTRELPWQRGPWPGRVRVGVAVAAPWLMLAAATSFDPPRAAVVSAFVLAMLLCTATDLLRFRVPNVVTYPGTALALVAAAVLPGGDPVVAAASALTAGLAFLALSLLTRGGLGLGDVKLAVLIGAALGFPGAYQALALGMVGGGLAILALFLAGVVSRRQAVPYAPFLALAAAFVALTQG